MRTYTVTFKYTIISITVKYTAYFGMFMEINTDLGQVNEPVPRLGHVLGWSYDTF